jgi:hypothetical protein
VKGACNASHINSLLSLVMCYPNTILSDKKLFVNRGAKMVVRRGLNFMNMTVLFSLICRH